jgi:hypothetical protein
MKRKAIYALGAGIIVVAAVILIITRLSTPGSNVQEQQTDIQDSLNSPEVISISVENVTAERDQENGINFQVQFRAFNPNKSTVILEAITYNIYTGNERIVSGDIGEKLEGFVASQESVFPIISNGTIDLKDSHLLQPSDLPLNDLNKILNGTAGYTINGTYSYKQTSSIEATGADRDFELTFH